MLYWRRLETRDWDHKSLWNQLIELINQVRRRLISYKQTSVCSQWSRPLQVSRRNTGLIHIHIGFIVIYWRLWPSWDRHNSCLTPLNCNKHLSGVCITLSAHLVFLFSFRCISVGIWLCFTWVYVTLSWYKVQRYGRLQQRSVLSIQLCHFVPGKDLRGWDFTSCFQ